MKQIGKILQTGVGRELLGGILENPYGKMVTYAEVAETPRTQVEDAVAAAGAIPGGADSRVLVDASKPIEQRSGDAVPWYPIPPDVGLFHELVHSYGSLMGDRLHNQGVGPNTGLEEEIRTTGVATDEYDYRDQYFSENTYRAERRLLGEDIPHRDRY